MAQAQDIKRADLWSAQIAYYRTHLDVFIEEYFNIKLKDVQKVVARNFGNCNTLYLVKSRGFGKTWQTAVCCLAMGVLYPGSLIAVVSSSAEQATLVLKKIDDYFIRNPDIYREVDIAGRKPVILSINKGICRLKNGSKIESYSMGTFRGNRAKIIVVDEAPEVKQTDLEAIVRPVRNTTRDVCVQLGISDYDSKMVSITSACLKSNYFFQGFVETAVKTGKGDHGCFACALDYKAAARVGITSMEFFEKEKKDLPEAKFQMEYGSIFVGAEANSIFPYELTERCRVLKEVEEAMPVKSSSDYVISVDLATSNAKSADNAVIMVFKQIECVNGSYIKRLVNIRTYHGKRMDVLAAEVRKMLVKFPNVIKVVFDHRGIGDAFPQFLSQPWIDPNTNKEYPPLVLDDERSFIQNAIPLLRAVRANVTVNQQMVSATKVALEQESLKIPINSRALLGNKIAISDDDMDDEDASGGERNLTMQERAIFIEADALQIEMGNIVAKETAGGSITYETAKTTQHKDRYTALAMGLRYISEIEDARKKRIAQKSLVGCIGIVGTFKGR